MFLLLTNRGGEFLVEHVSVFAQRSHRGLTGPTRTDRGEILATWSSQVCKILQRRRLYFQKPQKSYTLFTFSFGNEELNLGDSWCAHFFRLFAFVPRRTAESSNFQQFLQHFKDCVGPINLKKTNVSPTIPFDALGNITIEAFLSHDLSKTFHRLMIAPSF